MLDEVLAVPGNRAVYEALVEHLSNEQAVAFVGAGASAGMYPLWSELIEQLAEYAVAEGKAEPGDAERWKRDHTSTAQQRVRNIVRKLGEPHYHQFLRRTFGERRGGDGKRFTAIHDALLRLPFRGYVTTNYDPALDFARAEIRPASPTTGIVTWQDDDDIHGWLTGDVFEAPDACPILWLHGSWQRPAGIVLNAGEYATAYKPGLYRNTFRRLWEQDRLVFVGFGFNDPQFTFMVGEILRDIAGARTEPRHIAILGLRPDADGLWPGDDAIAELRAGFQEDYHVRPLFYFAETHEPLLDLLGALVTQFAAKRADSPAQRSSSPSGTRRPLEHWTHETTNDPRFTGREDEIARLDRWIRDDTVRAIGVTAVGGTGKTALIGHWLKETNGWRTRPTVGIFAWSFYSQADTAAFLNSFLGWTHDSFGTPFPDVEAKRPAAARDILRSHELLIVLDGLEVLQEDRDDSRHGSLQESLRAVLVGLCSTDHGSVALLTSRFVFPDLERYLGTSFHQLELFGLPPEEGARLLADLDVRGSDRDRSAVSRRLNGHPLALRLFAEAIPDEERDHPLAFDALVFERREIVTDTPLGEKVGRLLLFYERKLAPEQIRLLTVISLFWSPVTEEVAILLCRLLGDERPSQEYDRALVEQLRRLHARGLLSRHPIENGHGYSCHPILRQHFRAIFVRAGAGTAKKTADLLEGLPAQRQVNTPREVEWILVAIERLLDVGEVVAADAFWRRWFDDGWLLISISALQAGLSCALSFVESGERRRRCEEKLGRRRVADYLVSVGAFASMRGQLDLSAQYYADSKPIWYSLGDMQNVNIVEQNETEILAVSGRLFDASGHAENALRIMRARKDRIEERRALACRGWVQMLAGKVREAAEDFALGEALADAGGNDRDELLCHRATRWAELLLRTGHVDLATAQAKAGLKVCEANGWTMDAARCHWMLGVCALAARGLDGAEAELRHAEDGLRRSEHLFFLCRALLACGELALARRDQTQAHDYLNEVTSIASGHGLRLAHADALVLRGRVRVMIEPESADALRRAIDDADDALRIARECAYCWAERDALALQTEAHDRLAHRREAGRLRAETDTLSARLRLVPDDLRQARMKAVASREATHQDGGG